jgi:hypothetical protein
MNSKTKATYILGAFVIVSLGIMMIPGAFYIGLVMTLLGLTVGLPAIFYDYEPVLSEISKPIALCAPGCN